MQTYYAARREENGFGRLLRLIDLAGYDSKR